MSNKSSEKSKMSSIAYTTHMLRKEVAPPRISSNKKNRIRHASRELGWLFNRTRDLWYNDGRYKPSPDEIIDIENYTGTRYGRQEVTELDALISKADNLLHNQDQDFHSAFIDAVFQMAGALNRSRTKGD